MYLFISVLQGGAQVVVMDWISVLDHKHLPSAHSGAPCQHSALSCLPGTSWDESLTPDTESNVKNTCCGSSCWKNKFSIVFFWNPFGNMSFPPMWRHKVGTVWRGVGLGADVSDFKSSNWNVRLWSLCVHLLSALQLSIRGKSRHSLQRRLDGHFFPSTCSLWRAWLGLRFCSCQIPFLIFSTWADAMDRSSWRVLWITRLKRTEIVQQSLKESTVVLKTE